MAEQAKAVDVDVFICGAGPVGLLLGCILERMNVKTFIAERYTKEAQSTYGRACTLYPRTLELLDQLDLLEEMNQIGFIARNMATFKAGKRVNSRAWQTLFVQIGESYLNYLLNIRQKYSEMVFLKRYRQLGSEVHFQCQLEDFSIHEDALDGRKIAAIVQDMPSGNVRTVRSKYIIGADGGKSIVRRLAHIPSTGDMTSMRWVRIDGIISTNMPDADLGFASIESKSHSNVLWVSLDHGRNRIGFALTDEMSAKYGDEMTEKDVKHEAELSMAPFSVEFDCVDWWTVYSIKEQVADKFMARDCIFLAGDACHLHSSGTAQGMNTGVHDAVNLGWKLGGVINGWYDEAILHTYESERRAVALNVIRLDKTFASLISGTVPEEYKRLFGVNADPNQLFLKVQEESTSFSSGLGIHYGANILNCACATGGIPPGHRGPDALVYAPGFNIPVRLFRLTKSAGAFTIIVFTGELGLTKHLISAAREYLGGTAKFLKLLAPGTVQFITIVAGSASLAEAILGGTSFGDVYYDRDHSAHLRYGVSTKSGAAVVLRPDDILGFAASLDSMKDIGGYFADFAVSKKENLVGAML